MLLKSKLKTGDLSSLVVGQEPIVGIAAVVLVEHDVDVFIDGSCVLKSFAGAFKLRLSFGIEACKAGDRGFCDHQARAVDSEIVIAGDNAGKAIHEDSLTMLRDDVVEDPPASPL